ncbi:choline ABC transporter ATP-binding protein [Limibacillus halophilus]
MAAVEFEKVDIIFGDNPKSALPLLDAGKTRDEILQETNQVLGVADASLKVEKGSICVLMGLSGSGKSTLLRAVNGLNKVTRGRVLVEASGGQQVDVANCSASTLRNLRMNDVAMVFQQFALLPWRTVEENVGLGLELRGLSKGERQKVVQEKLKLVSLDQWAGKYAHELSGGMQQRVGLARAFATDADILLMDEPFSALDPLIRDHLQDELLELQARLHKTIVFVSHDLDEALKLGNTIAIMEGGRIVQAGEPEEIVLNPANDYVAEFVAHMNPLKVLRGGTLMKEMAELERSDQGILLSKDGKLRLRLSGEGTPEAVVNGDQELRITLEGPRDDCICAASPDLQMSEIIALRHASGLPVLMVEEGKLVGLCDDEAIYGGILRQSGGGSAEKGAA